MCLYIIGKHWGSFFSHCMISCSGYSCCACYTLPSTNPIISGPPEAPVLELTPKAIWKMALEIAHSLLGLRGDEDTPMNIESIHEIMQQGMVPKVSQQLTTSSNLASSQVSSISGGSLGFRCSGKCKRTANNEQAIGKTSIHHGPLGKQSASSLSSTAMLPSMLVQMSGAANNITTLINHMMMFQDNLVPQGAASIIQNTTYLSEDEQANLILYFSNCPSVASTLSTLSTALLERTLQAALQDVKLCQRQMEQGLS